MGFGVLLACLLAVGSLWGSQARAEEPGPIRLLAQPAIRIDLEAFPRLGSVDAPSQRINQALANADDRVRVAAEACHADARDKAADPNDIMWRRHVTVAMRGPVYLALVAADQWYCGGPYPSATSFSLAYDLRTGAPLNWARLLPKALVQTESLDTAGDGTRLGVVAAPALQTLYRKIVQPDAPCEAVLRDSTLHFMFWPDAARNGVAMQPTDLAHAAAACGPDAVIPLATLRSLGADRALPDAIDASHQAGLFGGMR
jgi:hypothetical protein